MAETYKTGEFGNSPAAGTSYSNGGTRPESGSKSDKSGEAGRTLLIGLVGGLLSAAGYSIYQRLPDEQKAKLQSQARSMLESRINELRQNFNI